MAAKRSPILGYNHNVRYRGLVFHVQTEDSGVLSPHLFTHLFHGGVIVSTRKLVYDSGSAEESIKSLMQSQHKAVLKDLKKGSFDDKIDQYLGGTPGLLPRGSDAGEPERTEPLERLDVEPSAPIAAISQSVQAPITLVSVPAVTETPPLSPVPALSGPTLPSIPPSTIPPPLRQSGSQAAVVVSPPGTRTSTPTGPTAIPQVSRAGTPTSQPNAVPTARAGNTGSQPTTSRTITAERTSPSMRAVTPLSVPIVSPPAVKASPPVIPPSPEDDPPTFIDHTAGVAAALQNARTRQDLGPPLPSDFQVDSSPEIEMTLEVDDDSGEVGPERAHTPSHHPRAHRDTEVSPVIEAAAPTFGVPDRRAISDGIPRVVPATATSPTPARLTPDSIPPLPPASEKRVGASALPPTKTVTRPPAVAVVSRPLSNPDPRERNESDAIEVYAPPPSSVPDPPGPAERPGQYSLRRSKPVAVQPEPPMPSPPTARERSASESPRERTGGVPIPAGLSRPGAKSRPFAANATIPEPPSAPPPQQQRRSDQMSPLNPASASAAASRPGFRNPSDSSGLPSALPGAAGLSNSGIRRNTPVPQPAVAAPPPTPPPASPDHAHLHERTRTPTPARISPTRSHSSGPSPVVMTRPAVIVGAPTKTQPRVRKAREEEQGGRGFGQGLISEKSLDEVILAYLSEDAEDK